MSNRLSFRLAGRRAIAAMTSVMMITSAVHAAPAFAAKPDSSVTGATPRGGNNGAGVGTVVATDSVKAGGTVTLTLSGFEQRPNGFLAVKLNDSAIKLPTKQSKGLTVDDGAVIVKGDLLPNKEGAATIAIAVPADLQAGDYWLRVIGGKDGSPVVSKTAWFTVTGGNTDTPSETLATGTTSEGKRGVEGVDGSKPRGTSGAGELTVVNADTTVTAGDVLTVKGTGFDSRDSAGDNASLSIKLMDGPGRNKYGFKLLADQAGADVKNVTADGTGNLTGAHLPGADGDFTFAVRIPKNIPNGWYWLRVLGGPNNGGPVSKAVWFKVAGGTPVAAKEAPKVEAPAGGSTSTRSGAVTYPVTITGLEPKQEIKATIVTSSAPGAEAVVVDAQWAAGHGPTKPTITADDKGTVMASVVAPAADVKAGKVLAFTGHTLNFYDAADTGNTKPLAYVRPDAGTKPGMALSNPKFEKVANTSIGSTIHANIFNLPEGTTITWLGSEDTNLATGDHVVGKDFAAVFDVEVPNRSSLIGKPVIIKAVNSVGKQQTFATGTQFTANNAPFGQDQLTITHAPLAKGLYQSAYMPDEKALYVSAAYREMEGGSWEFHGKTLKVDPVTLKELASVDTSKGRVFGIGVDTTRNRVWGTETIKNRVIAFDKNLKKEFETSDAPDQQIKHARVPAIDETTGVAYVSSPITGKEEIAKVDPRTKQVTRVATPGFKDPMGSVIDQATGTFYTVSLDEPKVMALNVRDASAAPTIVDLGDHIKGGSDVAWDPETKTLWAVGQQSANAVAIDMTSGTVVADIPTGDGALGVAYEPVSKKIFVANRVGGTVTVIDAVSKKKVANIDAGMFPNHVSVDGLGHVFVVNKITGAEDDAVKDEIFRLEWKKTPDATEPPAGDKPSKDPSDADGKPGQGAHDGDNHGDHHRKDDGSSMGGALGIGVLVAIIAGIYQALISGMVPSTLLPPQLRDLLNLK